MTTEHNPFVGDNDHGNTVPPSLTQTLETVTRHRDALYAEVCRLETRLNELIRQRDEVQEERRHAVAALSEQVDTLQRMVCSALYTDPLMQRNHAKVCGWDCYKENTNV